VVGRVVGRGRKKKRSARYERGRQGAGTCGGGTGRAEAGAPPPASRRRSARACRRVCDVAAGDKVLRELAHGSGGDYRFEDFGRPAVRAPRDVRVGKHCTVELWSSPFLLLADLALLTTEWYLRRRAGHSRRGS
jgi:hypothetical protein